MRKEKTYIIKGDPIPLARGRYSSKTNSVWDCQKQEKLIAQFEMRAQHDNVSFVGPLHIDVTFFMKIPKNKNSSIAGNSHIFKPDLSNLLKFIEDIGTGILYHDDCLIASVFARKIYDENPRTEITVREIDTKINCGC